MTHYPPVFLVLRPVAYSRETFLPSSHGSTTEIPVFRVIRRNYRLFGANNHEFRTAV